MRYAAAPTIAVQLALEADRPGPLALSTRRSGSSSDAARLRRRRPGPGWSSCSGTPERWGVEAARCFLWTNTTLVVPPFDGATQPELHDPRLVRPRGRGREVLPRAGGRRRAARVPVQRHASSTSTRPARMRTARIPWERRRAFRLPVRSGRRRSRTTSRAARGCACGGDVFDRLLAVQGGAHAPDLGGADVDLVGPPIDGRRALRRLTDAGPVRGLLLWPYRRSALKNPKRWTFGGVFLLGHKRRAPGRPRRDPGAVPARARRRRPSTSRVRFLHVVRRERLAGTVRPWTSSPVAGGGTSRWDEATERELEAAPGRTPIAIPAGSRRRAAAGRRQRRPLLGARARGHGRPRRPSRSGDGLSPRHRPRRERDPRGTAATARTPCGSTFCSTHAVLRADPRRGFCGTLPAL